MDDSTLGTFFNYLLANEDINLKKAAAVFLKDYIRDYWMDNTDPALASPQKCLSPQVKESFKQNVLGLLLQAHPSLYPIIIEMILTVVHSAGGYLNIWPNLMSSLSQILQEGNYSKSLQIYYLITKTIKRYHYESKTEELFNEIQNTLDIICPRLTLDAGNILTMLENQQVGGDNLKNALIIMKRIFDIFYSLNYQDFPAYFEDHLQDWMNYLAKSLQLNIPNLDPEQTEWMKKLKAKTLKCLNLYFSNYYDDFSQYAPHFYPMVWEYLQGVSGNDDFSVLEKQLLEFFNINFKTGRLTQMQDQQLQTLIDKLIIPNLQISDKESEMFEDTPMEFIKAEFEETDMDSNKYYAMGLLQNIAEANQNLISSTIQPMIQRFLQEYESNRNALFKKKISAINLIFAIAIKTFAQRSKTYFY
ncbi:MAG: hypothetical protein MJ252_15325 [archaeon]|nr:hypothetical protein [archaeon]